MYPAKVVPRIFHSRFGLQYRSHRCSAIWLRVLIHSIKLSRFNRSTVLSAWATKYAFRLTMVSSGKSPTALHSWMNRYASQFCSVSALLSSGVPFGQPFVLYPHGGLIPFGRGTFWSPLVSISPVSSLYIHFLQSSQSRNATSGCSSNNCTPVTSFLPLCCPAPLIA